MTDLADEIREQADQHREAMVAFLREIVAIPSESGQEGKVIARIREEMERVGGFDEVYTDPMGNLFGRIGTGKPLTSRVKGKPLIAIDAHVDTVGIGNPQEWKHDPYQGKVADGKVYGRGAGDQKGAVPAMVYAGRIIRDLDLYEGDWSLLVAFTVMEEDCDGLCWQYIVQEGGVRPDCVVVTDSTNCRVLRGQRGRMEIGVTATGRSCHASMPHKGDNAVYKIAKVAGQIEKLNGRLRSDPFLGKGTATVTYVDCQTPSVCAVPGRAFLHVDRRLTTGDTKASAVREVREAVRRAGVSAKVEVLRYSRPSYTGLVYETEKYFPTWCEPAEALQVRAAVETYKSLFRRRPKVSRWTFSTNAVSIAGRFGIPCVGFGPAAEEAAHTVNDAVPIEQIVQCAAFYAAFPGEYCRMRDAG